MVQTNQITCGEFQGLHIEVYSDLDDVAAPWREFQLIAAGGPHDSFEWTDAWLRTGGRAEPCEPLITVGRNDAGEIAFLLPLTIRNRFGCKALEWLADDHGNYSSGLYNRNAHAFLMEQDGERLLAALLAVLPDVDLVSLSGQPVEIDGMTNPLGRLPGVAAASAGYALPMNLDWQSHYRSRFSSNYRRNLRRNERRLAELGSFAFERVDHVDERLEIIDFIIGEKRKWLAERGIEDFLACEKSQEFYRELACITDESAGLAPCIHVLKAGGENLSASLDVIFQNRFYGLIAATTSGPQKRHGPGKLLLKYTIREMANAGISVIDLGAGEEDNKLRWCTERRDRHDSIVPITTRGRLYGEAHRATLLAKLHIKQSPGLWHLATQLRRWKSGSVPERS